MNLQSKCIFISMLVGGSIQYFWLNTFDATQRYAIIMTVGTMLCTVIIYLMIKKNKNQNGMKRLIFQCSACIFVSAITAPLILFFLAGLESLILLQNTLKTLINEPLMFFILYVVGLAGWVVGIAVSIGLVYTKNLIDREILESA